MTAPRPTHPESRPPTAPRAAPGHHRSGRRSRSRRDAGQALPVLAGALALVVVLLLGVVALGNLAHDRAAAQTAADAAALAGAAEGRGQAQDVAAANHGRLESFATQGDDVEVVVRVGDARATARARRSW